jgi:hypothetical protein
MLSRPLALSSARTLTDIWLVTLERPLAAEVAALGKLVLDLLVFIAHAAPVIGVVLPMLDTHVVSIYVPVEVKILIDIDVWPQSQLSQMALPMV